MIKKLKEQLQTLETQSASMPKDRYGRPPSSHIQDNVKPEITRGSSDASVNGATRKFPKKRPVLSSSNKEDSSVSNGVPSRPSSTTSSARGSLRQSQTSYSTDSRPSASSPRAFHQSPTFPKANVIEPSLLLSYLTQSEKSQPSILLLDVRSKDQYEKGFFNADHVVWIDPILIDQEYQSLTHKAYLCFRISGKVLEESLVLCPIEQQDWFSNRHLFDLVIIYDEDSRVNSYAGGPALDRQQVRLRNLTVAIFDYAGYHKPLKHVPMLLVGGLRAWCNLVREHSLRKQTWNTDNTITVDESPRAPKDNSTSTADFIGVKPKIHEIDLDAEAQWLESLQQDGFAFISNNSNSSEISLAVRSIAQIKRNFIAPSSFRPLLRARCIINQSSIL